MSTGKVSRNLWSLSHLRQRPDTEYLIRRERFHVRFGNSNNGDSLPEAIKDFEHHAFGAAGWVWKDFDDSPYIACPKIFLRNISPNCDFFEQFDIHTLLSLFGLSVTNLYCPSVRRIQTTITASRLPVGPIKSPVTV